MTSEYLKFKGYLTPGFKPDPNNFIICNFYLEPAKDVKFSEAAVAVAAESSIGTWTEVGTLSVKTRRELAAKIFYLNPKKKVVKIAYPLKLFEPGNISQFLSNCAGNVFSMKIVKNLRLEDVEFPKKYIQSFPGPQLGLAGVRQKIGVFNRPLIGAIIKPKLGLSAKEHARCAYECFIGGVDLVKDDENLTNQNFNRFAERVRLTLKLAKRAEKETGEKKICAFNISAPTAEMIKRAKFVKKMGGNCIMVDVVTVGFSALQELRHQNLGLIIHAHRAMHSAFTRNPKHGISMLVLAKLLRLAGVDQLHTGTVVGKMEGGKEDVLKINKALKQNWPDVKPVLPIASGGLHPASVSKLIKILGKDLIINFGGGIHGHPQGTLAGAKAVRQAIEATMKNISLKEYAKKNLELKIALEHWKL
ncbi:MAG: type III ribulose-bisphosphate carboxylase [Patescibacteria group bacterium]